MGILWGWKQKALGNVSLDVTKGSRGWRGLFFKQRSRGNSLPSVSQQVERVQLISEPNVFLLETGGAVKLRFSVLVNE